MGNRFNDDDVAPEGHDGVSWDNDVPDVDPATIEAVKRALMRDAGHGPSIRPKDNSSERMEQLYMGALAAKDVLQDPVTIYISAVMYAMRFCLEHPTEAQELWEDLQHNGPFVSMTDGGEALILLDGMIGRLAEASGEPGSGEISKTDGTEDEDDDDKPFTFDVDLDNLHFN